MRFRRSSKYIIVGWFKISGAPPHSLFTIDRGPAFIGSARPVLRSYRPQIFCLGLRFGLCQIKISVSAADNINHFTGRTSDHDTKGLRDRRIVTLWLTPFWPIMSASKSASKQACLQECRLAQRASSSWVLNWGSSAAVRTSSLRYKITRGGRYACVSNANLRKGLHMF